jgi:hypothetical protein
MTSLNLEFHKLILHQTPVVLVELTNSTDSVVEVSQFNICSSLNGLYVAIDGKWILAFDFDKSKLVTPPFWDDDALIIGPKESRLELIELPGRVVNRALLESGYGSLRARIDQVIVYWSVRDRSQMQRLASSWSGTLNIESP